MDKFLLPETMRIVWLVLGVALIILEIVIPGAVVVFFGIGAIITGIAAALGLVKSVGGQLFLWASTSLILVLLLRKQVSRFFPALESYKPYDEAEDMKGKIVDVLEEVRPDDESGRVRYQGASWKALTKGGTSLPAGSRARIVSRENLLLYVEATDASSSEKSDF